MILILSDENTKLIPRRQRHQVKQLLEMVAIISFAKYSTEIATSVTIVQNRHLTNHEYINTVVCNLQDKLWVKNCFIGMFSTGS